MRVQLVSPYGWGNPAGRLCGYKHAHQPCTLPERELGVCGALTQAKVELFASSSYELGEAEYAANEAEDVWVQGLVASAETTTTFLQTYLTGSNYESWVQVTYSTCKLE